jgi:hypothetical protein
MKKLILVLISTITAIFVMAVPLASLAAAATKSPSSIAEVADEIHPYPPMNEVQRDLNPDRARSSAGSYNGTLESLPNMNLPR